MKKIEAIIRPDKLEEIKKALSLVGVNGMTVMEVEGFGKQPAQSRFYRGNQFTVDLIPKTKIEVIIPDEKKDEVVKEIINVAKTGEVGDGKIFVSTISEAYRIRTEERDNYAI